MAYQMEYTDAAGNVAAASYWAVAEVHVTLSRRQATLIYYGWSSAANQAAGLAIMQGATHAYTFTGAAFAAFFSQFATSSTPFLAAADALAMATQDCLDANGNPTSFFAGATQVANPTVQ